MKILHRRIEDLLHDMRQAVDLVDEKDILFVQIRQNRRQITRSFDHRTGGHLDIHPHLPGHDVGQGRLSETGRTIEEHMIEGLLPLFGRLDEDGEILLDLLLTDIFGKAFRTQRDIISFILFNLLREPSADFLLRCLTESVFFTSNFHPPVSCDARP